MVETFDVSITPYGLTRRTFVYLPDDWQTSGKKYPVLYMFDGHNLFFDSTATYGTCWGLKEYCDAHPNWIIAAPECNHEGNKRLEEYCPYQSDWFGGITGTGHEYMEWLTKEFKPMMDKRYPTLPGRHYLPLSGRPHCQENPPGAGHRLHLPPEFPGLRLRQEAHGASGEPQAHRLRPRRADL